MNLFVGNLAWALSEEGLKEVFAAFGPVKSAQIISDRETGRSRGFGFVEMENAEDGTKAIEGLNGTELEGRALNVREAEPRQQRR